MRLSWYAARLGRMSGAEIGGRACDEAYKLLWRRRQVRDEAEPAPPRGAASIVFATPFSSVPCIPANDAATAELIAAAEAVLAGRWVVLGSVRTDLAPVPDWFRGGATDLSDDRRRCSFDIDWRDETRGRDVKRIWELSRHHHLTVLAAAFAVTGDTRYAERAADHLRSWWRANPFLSGIHWTMGIEVGMRLIAWVWIRRLLQDWPEAPALFERNAAFVRQLYWHQAYLARFRSHGSSANNHLLAEAAGRFAAACAFRGFAETDRWRSKAAEVLRREIPKQTFPDGVNRELATDYHGFVLELSLVSIIEGYAAGFPLGRDVWRATQGMADALAALLDAEGRPPRQGDGDDGTALLLDAPGYRRCDSLLASGARLFTAAPWWPRPRAASLRGAFWAALSPQPFSMPPRAPSRPSHFPHAGIAILRDSSPAAEEIWCRCDHGPHGLPPLAAHAHADALSVELRVGGVEILADPGTYCYQRSALWRRHFRSTLAHNCLELGNEDQSVAGGAFLWLRPARSQLLGLSGLDGGPVAEWRARHEGYRRLEPSATHERSVRLDRRERSLAILDRVRLEGRRSGRVRGRMRCRLAFQFGPAVEVVLDGTTAWLRWDRDGQARSAVMALPDSLAWVPWRGTEDPPLGWYSPSFGKKQPAFALAGEGWIEGDVEFATRLQLTPSAPREIGLRGLAAARPPLPSSPQVR